MCFSYNIITYASSYPWVLRHSYGQSGYVQVLMSNFHETNACYCSIVVYGCVVVMIVATTIVFSTQFHHLGLVLSLGSQTFTWSKWLHPSGNEWLSWNWHLLLLNHGIWVCCSIDCGNNHCVSNLMSSLAPHPLPGFSGIHMVKVVTCKW